MIDHSEGQSRMRTLQFIVLLIFGMLFGRLVYLQLFNPQFKEIALLNTLRQDVQYAPRGEVVDRKGEYIVRNRPCYDLMVIKSKIQQPLDTATLCEVTGVSMTRMRRELRKADPFAPHLVAPYLSTEDRMRFDESRFPGFYTVQRTMREYPRHIGGNLLGEVGEIDATMLKRRPEYRKGDYIGKSGLEKSFETLLRGQKGVIMREVDARSRTKSSFKDGKYDTLPTPGAMLTSTIDAKLQRLGEELMAGKVGAAVAIEPSTGEILMMVSSPTFDPTDLLGRQRGENYVKMLHNRRNPMFNRAVSAKYPPGSTFKLVQGLIGLQEGVLKPGDLHPCSRGYHVGKLKVGCHLHESPIDLRRAVATSCNAYFCYVFRDIIDNKKYGNVKEGFDVWREYVESFGFGRKLESDFLDEGSGYVPTRALYDKKYRGSWNSLTVVSLSIGQGELGCTPLQLANLACIVANRGYYYIPHIIKSIEGQDSLDRRFYERQYTKVDSIHFVPIIEGMWNGVHVNGTSTAARLDGWNVCGKTGTAQNPHGKDHSTFLSFAPKDNPKIAISVYVENGGFGAAMALPIASLLEEYYLTDTIKRPALLKQIKEHKIYYPKYDSN